MKRKKECTETESPSSSSYPSPVAGVAISFFILFIAAIKWSSFYRVFRLQQSPTWTLVGATLSQAIFPFPSFKLLYRLRLGHRPSPTEVEHNLSFSMLTTFVYVSGGTSYLLQLPTAHYFTNEVILQLYVLRSRMEHRVVGEAQGTLSICKQHRATLVSSNFLLFFAFLSFTLLNQLSFPFLSFQPTHYSLRRFYSQTISLVASEIATYFASVVNRDTLL